MDITEEKILCTATWNINCENYAGVYGTLAELKAAIKEMIELINDMDGTQVEFPADLWGQFVGEAHYQWQKTAGNDKATCLEYVFEDGSSLFASTMPKVMSQKLFNEKNKALTAAHDALVVLGDWLESQKLDKEFTSHPLMSSGDIMTHKPLGNIIYQTLSKIRAALSGKVKK